MIVALVILAAQGAGLVCLFRWTRPPAPVAPLTSEELSELQAIRIARQIAAFGEQYGKQLDVLGNAIADTADYIEKTAAGMGKAIGDAFEAAFRLMTKGDKS